MIQGKTLTEWATLAYTRLREWPRETWAALAVVALAVLLRLNHLDVPTDNYDEGVYTASLRSLAAGHPLFAQVYSAQPPLFLLALLPWFRLFGQTLLAARLGVALYSLIGLGAMWWLGNLLGGRRVALVALALLAVDPLYLQQSRAVQAEAPALAFAILAVACAASARRTPDMLRAALAGAAFAVALLIKLFVVTAIIPIAAFLLAPFFRILVTKALEARRWPERAHWVQTLQASWPTIAASAVTALVIILVVALAQPDRAAEWAQVIGLHLQASHGGYGSRADNLGVFVGVWWEWPLILAGLGAGYLGWQQQRWAAVALALWGGASLLVLAVQVPLFTHHLALLPPAFIPAAALLGEMNLSAFVEKIRFPTRSANPSQATKTSHPSSDDLPSPPQWGGVGGGANLLVLLLVIAVIVSAGQTITAPRTLPQDLAQATGDLQQFTLPGDWVVTDNQMAAVLADRQTPPALVDTSLVRITAGALTTAQVIAAASDPRVTAILWSTGRFDHLPGLHAWVLQHYTQVLSYGGLRGLYLRAPPGGVPVG